MDGKVIGNGLSLFILVVMCTNALGLRCLSCNHVPHVEDCFRSEAECEVGVEQCFLTRSMLPNMDIVYTAGCRSDQVCKDDELQIGNGKRQMVWNKGEMVELELCQECCNTPPDKDKVPCNGYLCGQHPNISSSSVWCAECDAIPNPQECSKFVQCPTNEVCSQEQIIRGGKLVYNLGCERKEVCDATLKAYKATHAKRDHGDLQICSSCCNTRDCNQAMCKEMRGKQQYFMQNNG